MSETRRLDSLAKQVDNEEVIDEARYFRKLASSLKRFPDPYKNEPFLSKINGPIEHMGREAALFAYTRAAVLGVEHIAWENWQKEFGGEQGMNSNLVLPSLEIRRIDETRNNRSVTEIVNKVVLSHPADCKRIASTHVKKQGNFTPALFSSVISTTDNDHWRSQRKVLTKAFMPKSSLREIFPISAARGKFCAQKLLNESKNGTQPVEMNEFLLHEAKAQLRMALFGESQEQMEMVNKPFRDAMSGIGDAKHNLRRIMSEMATNMVNSEEEMSAPTPDDKTGINAPLAKAILDASRDCKATLYGNNVIFSFAGHDTTGHTMTWLLYELSRHPDIQKRLQKEIDEQIWAVCKSENREITYDDFKRTPFLTRCIMETMRLWPAVCNGTFRELEYDDWITGKNGEKVILPKGTRVQISTWSRHRNPDLWGPTASQFDPDRDFVGAELWDGKVFTASNPNSERFSPFTYPPRDCIGKNFAQMEIRVVISNLLRDFNFLPYDDEQATETHDVQPGINYGTLAPKYVQKTDILKRQLQIGKARVQTGVLLRPVKRVR
eukprot:TRINITY_DN17225_c0_g1_i1.p1 TRINITY_DN17225_c0_g1~~TRINITY_DN17225_c0_g1_i1.p1  ORF type:complete len:568 (+),score=117.18 TRINITY_DN17225_c0_g1_i1:54-1706(+)